VIGQRHALAGYSCFINVYARRPSVICTALANAYYCLALSLTITTTVLHDQFITRRIDLIDRFTGIACLSVSK